jgi:hypothetical protein
MICDDVEGAFEGYVSWRRGWIQLLRLTVCGF